MITLEELKANGIELEQTIADKIILLASNKFAPEIDRARKEEAGKVLAEIDNIYKDAGIELPSGKKKTAYLSELIKQVNGELSTLKPKVSEYESLIKDAPDKAKINDLQNETKLLREQLIAKDKDILAAKTEFETQKKQDKIVSKITAKLPELRNDIPAEALEIIKNTVIRGLLQSAELDGEIVIFRNQNGEILRNPANALQPYTVEEMLLNDPTMKGLIKEDGGAKGVGANKPTPPAADKVIDLSNLSKEDAMDKAHDYVTRVLGFDKFKQPDLYNKERQKIMTAYFAAKK